MTGVLTHNHIWAPVKILYISVTTIILAIAFGGQKKDLGMGRSIPIDTFLVGWTSIYQLFWGSPGTRVLSHPHFTAAFRAHHCSASTKARPCRCGTWSPDPTAGRGPHHHRPGNPADRGGSRLAGTWCGSWERPRRRRGLGACVYIYIHLYIYLYKYTYIYIYISLCVCRYRYI